MINENLIKQIRNDMGYNNPDNLNFLPEWVSSDKLEEVEEKMNMSFSNINIYRIACGVALFLIKYKELFKEKFKVKSFNQYIKTNDFLKEIPKTKIYDLVKTGEAYLKYKTYFDASPLFKNKTAFLVYFKKAVANYNNDIKLVINNFEKMNYEDFKNFALKKEKILKDTINKQNKIISQTRIHLKEEISHKLKSNRFSIKLIQFLSKVLNQ